MVFCSKRKLCEGDCDDCLERSFASHSRSKNWSPKNLLTPEEVFKSSGNKRWFICDNGHDFESTLDHILNGTWCPFCFNKTESKVNEYLKSINIDFIKEAKFDWCLSTKGLYRRFDFYIPLFRLVIEVDGDQHFRQIRNWKSLKVTKFVDVYKAKLALNNNISILRIYQEDIFFNRINWIEIIQNNLYERKIPDIKYFSTKDLYQEHNKIMQELNINELNKIIEENIDTNTVLEIGEIKGQKLDENVMEKNDSSLAKIVTHNKTNLSKMSMNDLKKIAKSIGISDVDSYREKTKKGKTAIINDILKFQ